MEFKEGQTYICTESHGGWWTEGKEYKVRFDAHECEFGLIDDEGTFWSDELNLGVHKFKLREENKC